MDQVKFKKETDSCEKKWLNKFNRRLKKAGVDPYKDKLNPKKISNKKLKQKMDDMKKELEVIKEYMKYLYNFIKGNGYIISFLDKDGYVLDILGDKNVKKKFLYNYSYEIGVKWNMDEVGTNASSLALERGEPVQLIGNDHYCHILHDLGCSASPVKNEEEEITGVLKITGLIPKVNPHTLGMVVTSAKAIHNQLKLRNLNKKLRRKNKLEKAIFESISEGILFVNKDGIIKFMNKTGAEILNVNQKEVIGKHVTEIVDFRPVILDVLESGEGYEDKEFYLKSHGELLHFIKTTKVLRNEKGEIQGVLDSFREIKRIKKIVNDMTGAQANFTFEDIIGQSYEIKKCKEKAKMAANSNSNVLIEGKTGTGKEMFAQAIHKGSSREEGPFVAINCAALPPQLMESELFGYVEGSFTGAKKGGRPGKFEMANGGTIFLDEIGELPLNMQAKLLRVLQEKKIIRIGGKEYIPVDVRVIAATNKELVDEVKKNNFREDLFYRLNVLDIKIPSLKNRKDDIILLANHFLARISSKLNKNIDGFSPGVKEFLKNYDWPGNVRELENMVEKMVNYCESNLIDTEILEQFYYREENNEFDLSNKGPQIVPLQKKKKEYIQKVVDYCDNNITKAAELLEVSRKTIYDWLD